MKTQKQSQLIEQQMQNKPLPVQLEATIGNVSGNIV